MNQVIKKLVNDLSQVGRYSADLVNCVSWIDSKYGAAIMAATPYVILGSTFIYMYVKRCWGSERGSVLANDMGSERGRVLTRSMSLAELHGGDLALQRLLSYNEAQANPKTLENVELLLDAFLKQEHLDFKYLQNTVAKLEMSAREETALELLKKAKEAHENKPHESYEIEMLIVEMLIYEEDYDEACKRLEDLDKDISDARRPFYQAILQIAHCEQEEKAKNCREEAEKAKNCWEKAKNCWEEFVDIRRQFRDIIKPPPSLQTGAYDTIIDFPQFKEKVQELIRYIKHVAKKDA